MKVGQNGFKGSFGIPPEIKEAGEKFMRRQEKEEVRPKIDLSGSDENEYEEEVIQEEEVEESANERLAEDRLPTPEDNLKKVGIDLTDEDFHKILFKGYVEKEVEIFPSIGANKRLYVTMKTLTGHEYDEVDELLAEEIRDKKMTNEGYTTRRSMWILSYGISAIQGKKVHKDVLSDDNLDTKETAKKKRDVLGRLSPAVLTKLMRIHGIFTANLNLIVEDPESQLLKKR